MDSITINITETPTEVTVNVFDATAALRGGTTGQVLTKASNTDLDFTWAAGGGGGGTVDSVSGVTDRIIITGTAVDPIVNIASGYDVAITNEIAAAILPTIPVISGQWRGSIFVGTSTTGAGFHNVGYMIPYFVQKSHYVTGIRCFVSTSVALTTVRLGLYAQSNYSPTTLLGESGALDASAAGVISYTFASPILLDGPLYWMTIQTSASTVGLRHGSSGTIGNFPTSSGTSHTHVYRISPLAYGAFPNPASPVVSAITNGGTAPFIELLVQ